MKSRINLTWLTTFWILIASAIPFSLHAQTRKISIQVDNQTVAQVMKLIEQKSGFTFVYKDDVVDTSRKVSISASNEDVLDILKQVFAGTETEATIVNRNINLIRKEPTSVGETSPAPAQGPSRKVSGTVLDTQGQPVVGATVLVDGTQNGVMT